jgi:hypothetical protein
MNSNSDITRPLLNDARRVRISAPFSLSLSFSILFPLSSPSSPMPDMSAIANPQQRQFNPYAENGGTILAIAGADFAVIAGDTRQSEGYSIQTRYAPKVFRLYAVHLSIDSHSTDASLLGLTGLSLQSMASLLMAICS